MLWRRWKARRISFDTKHHMLWCNSSKRDGIHKKKEHTLHNLIEEEKKG
jgi:hypothetical protein